MTLLRVTFTACADCRRAGASARIHLAEPLLAYRMIVDDRPTEPRLRPLVPDGPGAILAEIASDDAPVAVAIGFDPDAPSATRLLVGPGRWRRVRVRPGERLVAWLAGAAAVPSDLGPPDLGLPSAVTRLRETGRRPAGRS